MGMRSPSMSGLNAGGGSPAQGRSVREYEEQMTSLRKENFNLKLRIYFLEEAGSNQHKNANQHPNQNQNHNHNHNYHQLSNNSAGDSSTDANNSHFKQNIDLKVWHTNENQTKLNILNFSCTNSLEFIETAP